MTLAQVFSCQFCKFFRDTYFEEHLWTTASKIKNIFIMGNAVFIMIISEMLFDVKLVNIKNAKMTKDLRYLLSPLMFQNIS